MCVYSPPNTFYHSDENGLEGLEEDREERKQKAQDNRANVMVSTVASLLRLN